MGGEAGQVTVLLNRLSAGDRSVEEELIGLVYVELKKIAGALLKSEIPGQSLQRTALVHDTCLKLLQQGTKIDWRNRPHFFAIAAKQMRRILIDHARSARAQKRSGTLHRIPLDAVTLISEGHPDYVLAIDDALNRLSSLDQRQAQIVEMRVYAGLSVVEIADVLGTSDRTVKRDWAAARAWLHRELQGLRTLPSNL